MQDLSVFDKVRVLIYRVHEKGLEVFLIKPKLASDETAWKLPHTMMKNAEPNAPTQEMIHLDPVKDEHGELVHSIAIEGDWHDVPSIRGMIKSDFNRLKLKINTVLPEMENGTFVGSKELIKKVLPHEYAAVKELREIIVDRYAGGSI